MSTEAIAKPTDELLTPKETATKLHVEVNTLAVWRCHKRYPLRYVKIGSKVFYRTSEIERFLEAHTARVAFVSVRKNFFSQSLRG